MIDIETFGTNRLAPVRQIGALVFDAVTGNEHGEALRVNVDTRSAISVGRVDAETIDWWLQPEQAEARLSLFRPTPVPLYEALCAFDVWWQERVAAIVEDDQRVSVWCHATFDAPILQSSYRSHPSLRCPFQFRQVRDLRTLFEFWPVELDRQGTHHDAVDDARHQKRMAVEALRRARAFGKSRRQRRGDAA